MNRHVRVSVTEIDISILDPENAPFEYEMSNVVRAWEKSLAKAESDHKDSLDTSLYARILEKSNAST